MPSIDLPGKTIGGSVGKGGTNQPADVVTVKFLLNNVPQGQGGLFSPLFVTSPLEDVIDAVVQFQELQFGLSDGRVDPGGRTIRLLRNFDPTPQSPPFVPILGRGKKGGDGKKGRGAPSIFIPTDPFAPGASAGGGKGGGGKGGTASAKGGGGDVKGSGGGAKGGGGGDAGAKGSGGGDAKGSGSSSAGAKGSGGGGATSSGGGSKGAF